MATASLSEMIAAPSQSLVKYETPTLVTNREAFEKGIKVSLEYFLQFIYGLKFRRLTTLLLLQFFY